MAKIYSRSEIKRGLTSKGFIRSTNDHEYLRFRLDGRTTHIKTKVSHGSGSKDVPIGLLKKMAEQCSLSLREFRDLVECPLSEEEYGRRVKNTLEAKQLPWSRHTRLLPPR